MALIYLVRHGEASAGFGSHADPGLSEQGQAHASAAAARLAPRGPLPILTSPLLRARQTAQPLCEAWRCRAAEEPRVAEVPSPSDDLATRSEWLRGVMRGSWSALPAPQLQWRHALLACLILQPEDVVIFSHFVAINLAVGAARGDRRMTQFKPGYGSLTRLRTDGTQLYEEDLGVEATTAVN